MPFTASNVLTHILRVWIRRQEFSQNFSKSLNSSIKFGCLVCLYIFQTRCPICGTNVGVEIIDNDGQKLPKTTAQVRVLKYSCIYSWQLCQSYNESKSFQPSPHFLARSLEIIETGRDEYFDNEIMITS